MTAADSPASHGTRFAGVSLVDAAAVRRSRSYDDAAEQAYRELAAASNDEPIPAALGINVYLPFCQSICFHCGCNRRVTGDRGVMSNYLARLDREIELRSELCDRDRTVLQLAVTGGTPAYLDQAQRDAMMHSLGRCFRLTARDERDYCIEIDPRLVVEDDLRQFVQQGFNRASFGVQDLDPAVQSAISRELDVEALRGQVRAARRLGLESVGIDLMSGLPRQSLRSFTTTIDATLRVRPDTVSLYEFHHRPHRYPAQRMIAANELPSRCEHDAIRNAAWERLTDAGYEPIGLELFALPDSALARAWEAGELHRTLPFFAAHRHCDIVGLGVGATSRIGYRTFTNETRIHDYATSLARGRLPIAHATLPGDDEVRRTAVVEALLCRGRVSFDEWEREFDDHFSEYFARELTRLRLTEGAGLVRLGSRALEITRAGRRELPGITAIFEAATSGQPGAVNDD